MQSGSRPIQMEHPGQLVVAHSPHEGAQRSSRGGTPSVADRPGVRPAAEGSQSGRRGTRGHSQLKQIFSNGKRKLLYEISGKIKFEGEELEVKVAEVTCSGDREWQAKGKKKEEREKLAGVGGKLVEAMVGVINRFK